MRHARVRRIVCLLSIALGLSTACVRKTINNRSATAAASRSSATGSIPDRGITAETSTKDNGASVVRALQDDKRAASGSAVAEPGNLLGSDTPRPSASTGTAEGATGGTSSVVISKTPSETGRAGKDLAGRKTGDPKERGHDARRIALASVVAAALIAAVWWLPKATDR
jgi:hypothetical protein